MQAIKKTEGTIIPAQQAEEERAKVQVKAQGVDQLWL
jgi:hypothetical protein